jgi:hypothetical protein
LSFFALSFIAWSFFLSEFGLISAAFPMQYSFLSLDQSSLVLQLNLKCDCCDTVSGAWSGNAPLPPVFSVENDTDSGAAFVFAKRRQYV